jgi:dTDP-glucose 4,6-dehydratase
MRNVLITGGAGFIGSNFIRYLLKHDQTLEITNLDALTYAGNMENVQDLPSPGRHDFVHGDICDSKLVNMLMSEKDIDTVVHFAAESHVDRSIAGPAPFVQTNVVGTLTLLEAARDHWVEEKGEAGKDVGFHHVSTDEVYGSLGADQPAWTEETPYAPNSPYAASKAASDHLVRAFGHTYGLPFTITNCSNNYGPYQFPEKLIPLMIINALQGKSLPVYGDGQQIRDWLYVEDHCSSIYMVLKEGSCGETYNIGGGNQPANIEIVETICSILDELHPDSSYCPHKDLITFVKDRPGHDRRYAMDAGKIKKELGWEPETGLREGLEKTVRWYLDHPEWVDAVRDGSDLENWLSEHYRQ